MPITLVALCANINSGDRTMLGNQIYHCRASDRTWRRDDRDRAGSTSPALRWPEKTSRIAPLRRRQS